MIHLLTNRHSLYEPFTSGTLGYWTFHS